MARIVLGIGASHTPLLTLDSTQWSHRAAADYANKRLNLSDGRLVDYPALLAEVGPRYADIVTPEHLERKARLCEAALDRLADALEAAAPDAVIVVGDDQGELFSPSIQPAVAIFHGETIRMSDMFGQDDTPAWMRQVGQGYLMDDTHTLPGHPTLAAELIGGLVDRGVDLATVAAVEAPRKVGFGHAFGFVAKRLFRGRAIPMVPLLLNTYFPPNVPTAARCQDIGRMLAEVLRASVGPLRVAIIASGGLSHFVVDEELDLRVIDAIASGNAEALRGIPRAALNSGSSEILNWVLAAGALQGLPLRRHDYQPLYRTPAGTGIGAAFCEWNAV
jgi:hypothetical protein